MTQRRLIGEGLSPLDRDRLVSASPVSELHLRELGKGDTVRIATTRGSLHL
jgi:hypothetical protein